MIITRPTTREFSIRNIDFLLCVYDGYLHIYKYISMLCILCIALKTHHISSLSYKNIHISVPRKNVYLYIYTKVYGIRMDIAIHEHVYNIPYIKKVCTQLCCYALYVHVLYQEHYYKTNEIQNVKKKTNSQNV